MTDDRALGRRLREADPAAGRSLDARERARLRDELVRAGSRSAPSAWRAWAIPIAAAALLAAVVLVALAPGRPREAARALPIAPVEIHPARPAPPTKGVDRGAFVTATEPVSTGRGNSGARPGPHAFKAATRILLTAPGGTRILWFPEAFRAKEDAS